MRLTDLIYSVTTKFREAQNFIRHPFQVFSQEVRRTGQEKLEEIELPLGQRTGSTTSVLTRAEKVNNNAASSQSQEEVRATTKQSQTNHINVAPPPRQKAELLPIPSDREIRGRRGRYRVVSRFQNGDRDRERVRLYQGIYVLNSKPVLIQEYLLPDRDFNLKKRRERREKLELLANVNLKAGIGQDFRLIVPWEAIAPPNEKRCYLIVEQIDRSATLREHLATGPMTSKQVRHVLNQVLQTLWFLHSQRVRFSNGEVQQGLAHGNLSLDSLLIAIEDQPSQQFLIYVADLALWEHLFEPPTTKLINPTFAGDLIDLGYVSFYLLSGGTVNSSGQPLDPKQQWPSIEDDALEGFIRRLIGLDKPLFGSAWDALQALLALPKDSSDRVVSLPSEATEVKTSRFRLLLIIIGLGLLGGFVGGLIWIGWRSLITGKSAVELVTDNYPCCFKDVNVPKEKVSYLAEGRWRNLLQDQNSGLHGKTLQQALTERAQNLLDYTLNSSSQNAIAELQSGSAAFALTSQVNNLPDSLLHQEVANDALVVFVAFSDAKREQSIPHALNGKITLNQLKQLYTGENWGEPDSIKQLKVKLYIPTDEPEAVQLFKQLVLQNDSQQIAEFENLSRKAVRIPQKEIFGNILNDFEKNHTVGISFGLLSKVFGQCSVYPLAVGSRDREVQALVRDNGKPINPTIDLCNEKGSYRPNINAFNSEPHILSDQYPLRYPLAVVYRKDSSAGKSYADLLKTDEGQYLLSQVGLVPQREVELSHTSTGSEHKDD